MFTLMMRGLTHAVILKRMFLYECTVRNYASAINGMLHVPDRIQVVVLATGFEVDGSGDK
jgi:DNA-binding NarL/FixJ family response regulator